MQKNKNGRRGEGEEGGEQRGGGGGGRKETNKFQFEIIILLNFVLSVNVYLRMLIKKIKCSFAMNSLQIEEQGRDFSLLKNT